LDTPNKPKRGLSALLASTTQAPAPAPAVVHAASGQAAQAAPAPVIAPSITSADIPLTAIRPSPTQPRTYFDPEALAELAASIKARGLVQPVVVRSLKAEEATGGHRYELIAGERRWRASQIAGLTVVPAVIKEVFDQRDILLLSLVENLQRDDLNPLEEALAYQRLADTFNLTHEQIADGVGKSRATVSNSIRILDLPTSIQDALKMRKLSIGHAKILLTIPDTQIQSQLASKAQAEGLTVRDLEKLISWEQSEKPKTQIQSKRPKGSRNTRVTPAHLQDLERRLREHFGTKVAVEEGLRKGRIVIEFYSTEDFERIAKLMGLSE
jgi:ParB family transcriptional regulator, chromosome partitioning protein